MGHLETVEATVCLRGVWPLVQTNVCGGLLVRVKWADVWLPPVVSLGYCLHSHLLCEAHVTKPCSPDLSCNSSCVKHLIPYLIFSPLGDCRTCGSNPPIHMTQFQRLGTQFHPTKPFSESWPCI